MFIRPETPTDIPTIRAVTEAAFRGMAYSSQTEGAIIDALRRHGALSLSLVAVDDHETTGDIVGHIAFSPALVDGRDAGVMALGPVAVRPDRQRTGIGSRLIRDGLRILKERGVAGCVLVGSPAYYGRFGFRLEPALCPPDVPAQYFQALSFKGPLSIGTVAFHPGFGATE